MPKSKKSAKAVAKAARKSAQNSARKSRRLLRSSQTALDFDPIQADAADAADADPTVVFEDPNAAGAEDDNPDAVSDAGHSDADSDVGQDDAASKASNDAAGSEESEGAAETSDAEGQRNSDFIMDSEGQEEDLDLPHATARGGFITPIAVSGQKSKEDAGHNFSTKERKVGSASPLNNTPKSAQPERAAASVKGKCSDAPVRGNADSDDEVVITGETRATGEIPPSQASRASVHGRAPRRPLAPWTSQEDKEQDTFTTTQHEANAAVNNVSVRSRSRSPPPAPAGGAARG